MAEVEITPEALEELAGVPRTVQRRIRDVFVRLQRWPEVSGVKPLRGALAGSFRIRTGEYRVVFRVRAVAEQEWLITVWRIGYRGDVYD
jgi:mRNA-degrading endonuclease RelE of RelBE toxin-antitoxin system